MRIAALPWDIYSQAVSEKRLAQTVAFRARLERGLLSTLVVTQKRLSNPAILKIMAGTTGLEPATSAVTGQRSNQLSYVP